MMLPDGEVSYDIPYLAITNEVESELFDSTLEYIFSEEGQQLEKLSLQMQEVTLGTLQATGGATEAIFDFVVGTSTSWSGVGTLAGGYIMLDGASNFTGGSSRVFNGLNGSLEGDTENFMKNTYTHVGGDIGELIYQGIQITIGAMSVAKGLGELSKKGVKVFSRANNIAKAEVLNLATKTVVLDLGDQVVLVTQEATDLASTPMILSKTVINRNVFTQNIPSIGLYVYNTTNTVNGVLENEKLKKYN